MPLHNNIAYKKKKAFFDIKKTYKNKRHTRRKFRS